jgi:hypothetical protein
MPPRPLKIIWRRQPHSGLGAGCEFAYGSDEADACAGVWRERGLWRAEVWPLGRQVLGAYYVTPAKARQHLERWLQAHPWVALPSLDPRGIKGRMAYRPNPMMAQYLRLHAPRLVDDDGDGMRNP